MGIEVLNLTEEKKRHILSPAHFQFLSYKTLNRNNLCNSVHVYLQITIPASSVIFPASMCLYCN